MLAGATLWGFLLAGGMLRGLPLTGATLLAWGASLAGALRDAAFSFGVGRIPVVRAERGAVAVGRGTVSRAAG